MKPACCYFRCELTKQVQSCCQLLLQDNAMRITVSLEV